MKGLIVMTSLLLSMTVFAANKGYKLDIELSIDGKLVSKPILIVESGKKRSITQETESEESFLEVIADDGEIEGNKGILMKFKVGYLQKNGSKKVIARPIILARAGEESTITVAEESDDEVNKQEVALKVVATRRNL